MSYHIWRSSSKAIPVLYRLKSHDQNLTLTKTTSTSLNPSLGIWSPHFGGGTCTNVPEPYARITNLTLRSTPHSHSIATALYCAVLYSSVLKHKSYHVCISQKKDPLGNIWSIFWRAATSKSNFQTESASSIQSGSTPFSMKRTLRSCSCFWVSHTMREMLFFMSVDDRRQTISKGVLDL